MRSSIADFYDLFFCESRTGIWVAELKHPIRTSIPLDRQYSQLVSQAVVTDCNNAMARLCGCRTPRELGGIPLLHLFSPSPFNILMMFLRTRCTLLPWTVSEAPASDGSAHFFENMCIGRTERGRLVRIWGLRRMIPSETLENHRLRRVVSSLPAAQRRILVETVRGKTLKEIGAELSLRINTVETYRFRALRRLGFQSVAEMIRRSESLGLTELARDNIPFHDIPDIVSV